VYEIGQFENLGMIKGCGTLQNIVAEAGMLIQDI
jgi:hypothetical protein